ncbi:2-keto-4-pentenoate hydratase/2-oxohepta-3-ene-1,7-dioic acid hydratase (catechol pathway) [Variovorax sp. YR634]|uniref:fumarylacetoacetate hydrolase family protein n=1 Tax=Variovorax sp. YR634 TaxID=1884385 RepID=UPI00089CBDA3|nr:fumarylacetoacetate hydrolase family protein [Variovorax sp. YR634]SDZ44778.1 2-keto-4-pentenoate hydratase/2-oxohepta-3-ene-1,7-dioic acid hydratase (catechol pathway) [Variovorax sp. YR634]
MKLVTFIKNGKTCIGRLNADGHAVQDLSSIIPTQPGDMLAFIRGAGQSLAAATRCEAAWTPIESVQLAAPIIRPSRNIFCVGKNYREHAKEFNASGFDSSAKEVVPERPVIFTKAPSTVIGQGAEIPSYLDYTGSTDYEGELAVVIGLGGRGIAKADAMRHVYGYTIVNDVTARTLQQSHRQWFIGKSIDGFCPMGPALVTADEVPDPAALRLSTRVNGELRQDASVSELIFDIPTLIADISRTMTLEPGDLIATGTCAGVGIGFTPPRFLKPGDVVEVEIQPIGVLRNPVA